MKYARDHVHRYWDFIYRKALGASLLTFGIVLAIGLIFTLSLSSLINANPGVYMVFWVSLIAVAVIVISLNFANAHVATVKYMSKKEHKQHTTHMGLWVLIMALGALLFALPLLMFNMALEPFVFLFSFGGIMLITYVSVVLLFNVHYTELAFGAAVLWAMFAVSMFSFGSMSFNGIQIGMAVSEYTQSLILALSSIMLVLVFSCVGLMMISNSSKKLMEEFKYSAK